MGVVKLLLSQGAELDAEDSDGATALDEAIHPQRTDIVELLRTYQTRR